MNSKEACKFLGICETTFLQFVRAGKIPSVRLGRRLLFTESMLLHWLERQAGISNDGRFQGN